MTVTDTISQDERIRIGGLQHGKNEHGAVDPYGRLHDV